MFNHPDIVPCELCGADIGVNRRDGNAKYCKECSDKHNLEWFNECLTRNRLQNILSPFKGELLKYCRAREASVLFALRDGEWKSAQKLREEWRAMGHVWQSNRAFRNTLRKLYREGATEKRGERNSTEYRKVRK